MTCSEGFQRKEQAVAVAIDLKDAYNRVQFKLLMDLLIQYGVSLTPCLQQSPVQAADGPAHSIWSQPNTMLTTESSSSC